MMFLAREFAIPPVARSMDCISDEPVYTSDMTGRNMAKNSSISVMSSWRYDRSSETVNTEASTPDDRASTPDRTTVHATDLVTENRNASRIMSNRRMPYSAAHTATIAPPIACAMMRMKFAILQPVEYSPTMSVPPHSITM